MYCEQPASPAETEGTCFQAKQIPRVRCSPQRSKYSPKSKAWEDNGSWVMGFPTPAQHKTSKTLLTLQASDFIQATASCLHPYDWCLGGMGAGDSQGGLSIFVFSPWKLLCSSEGSCVQHLHQGYWGDYVVYPEVLRLSALSGCPHPCRAHLQGYNTWWPFMPTSRGDFYCQNRQKVHIWLPQVEMKVWNPW